MFIYRFLFILIITPIIILSCKSTAKDSEIETKLREMQSSPIDMALDSMHTVTRGTNNERTSYKYVAYFDSSECTNCQVAHFTEWNTIWESYKNDPIEFYYIFETADTALLSSLETINEKFPSVRVLMDNQKVFRKHNPQIPEGHLYHRFLLDSDNKTILVGNPVHVEKIAQLMNSIIKDGNK